jgi:nicotinamide mononucleotide transporter
MVSLFPENWLYWIVIDAVSVYLYLQRGLKLTALLFVVYTLLAINGYLTWI